MMHNTIPTIYFDGKSARPQQVRVLLFNNQLHLYDAEEDTLLEAYPLAGCRLMEHGSKPYLYLTAEQTSYLELNTANAITGMIVTELRKKQQGYFERLFKAPLLVLLGILVVLVTGVYFFFAEAVPRIALHFITPQHEEKLGQTFFNSLIEKEDIDSSASQLAQEFANHLQLSKTYRIKVYVAKQKQVNAFALPGGIVVINSGIIENMGTYEELAALLGHEVTHINDRHSLRSMMRQVSFTAFISIVTGDVQGISAAVISNAATLQSLSYSRGLESSADEKGMQLLIANQVNPTGMVGLLHRLEASGHGLPVQFLSSHPLTGARIRSAEEFVARHKDVVSIPHPELERLWKELKGRILEAGIGF